MIKEEKPQVHNQLFLLRTNGKCLDTRENTDYKVRLGVRNAKVKSDGDLHPVVGGDVDSRSDEGSADRSTSFEVRFSQYVGFPSGGRHRRRINTGALDRRRPNHRKTRKKNITIYFTI